MSENTGRNREHGGKAVVQRQHESQRRSDHHASDSCARITELNITTSRAELSAYSRAGANSWGIAALAIDASITPQVINVK